MVPEPTPAPAEVPPANAAGAGGAEDDSDDDLDILLGGAAAAAAAGDDSDDDLDIVLGGNAPAPPAAPAAAPAAPEARAHRGGPSGRGPPPPGPLPGAGPRGGREGETAGLRDDPRGPPGGSGGERGRMDRGAAFGGRAPWLPPQAPAANTALPSQAKPGQLIRLPGQTRVAPEEYREFLALGHGGIFDVDLDRVDPASAIWRQSDAVASDFFNYDLDETSWKEYCARVKDFQEQLALLPRGVPAGHIRHMAPGGARPGMPALPGPAGLPLSPGGGGLMFQCRCRCLSRDLPVSPQGGSLGSPRRGRLQCLALRMRAGRCLGNDRPPGGTACVRGRPGGQPSLPAQLYRRSQPCPSTSARSSPGGGAGAVVGRRRLRRAAEAVATGASEGTPGAAGPGTTPTEEAVETPAEVATAGGDTPRSGRGR